MIFENAEFENRVTQLLSFLSDLQLDAVLLDHSEALHYLTGFDVSVSNYRALIVKRDGSATFILRKLDVAPLRERSWVADIVGYADWEDTATVVARAMEDRGLSSARVGLSLRSHALTVDCFHRLQACLPTVSFTDIGDLPMTMRKSKSPAELAKLRRASEIADEVATLIVDTVKLGITERDVARIAADACLKLGADPGFSGIFTAGKGWDFLHGHLHDDPLNEGDILHVEMFPRIDGYSARLMRCIVVGDIDPEQERIAQTLIDLQDRQIAAMKPGAIAKDVDAVVRQGAVNAGLRQCYDNITAYTLGWYSDYWIQASDFTWTFHPHAEWVLAENMVFHVYTSARGFSLSETVVVGPAGGERMTKIERKLFTTSTRK